MSAGSFRQGQGILSLYEAQSYVQNLKRYTLADVGKPAWMAQHDVLEKLNIQAHHQALSGHDEFVKDAFVDSDMIGTLVHELLVVETWKEKVFPALVDSLAEASSVKVYMVMYHEATLCNLLEVLMYHDDVLEAAGDAIIELADYCYRHVVHLTAGHCKSQQLAVTPELARAHADQNVADTLRRQRDELLFQLCTCTITMLRFITEHLNTLPIAVVARLLDTHDVLMSLVPLVNKSPWTRRCEDTGDVQKYVDQKWARVADDDMAKLTKMEAQVWLCVYNIMTDETCRKKYEYHTHRRDVVVTLKRHFNDVLTDQLPMLRDLHRMVEELALMTPPPPTTSSLVIIEAVPEMRESIVKDADYGALATAQLASVFTGSESERRREIARLAATYNLENFDEVLAEPRCAVCGDVATQRCSRCRTDWYCGRKCQVDAWKKHKPLCDMMSKASKPAAAAAATPTAAKEATKSAQSDDTQKEQHKPAATQSVNVVQPTTTTETAAKVSATTTPTPVETFGADALD